MTNLRQLVDEVRQILHGYEQPRVAFLTASLTDTALTATVADASSVDQGIVEIEGELLYVQSVDKVTKILTIAPDGRGYFGTTAAAHTSGARVTISPVWTKNRIKTAISDTIVATYPVLFGTGQTQFTFNPSVTTYALPVEAEGVLAVTADLTGPSLEQQVINRWRFNSSAPTDDWATTNTLTLEKSVSPGRTVTVTYKRAPSGLTDDTDELTASGLRESAKLAVVYGACSMLVGYMDVSRLPVDTAQAGEYAEPNALGMASRIAGQLYSRYQTELENERKRLRGTNPVAVTMRRR